MTTIVKALLGGAVVAVSASATIMYVFRESIFSGLSREISELTSRCYVIPTTEGDNPAQLLICRGQDQLNGGDNSEYFLYNKDGNKKHIKVATINKKENTLEVTLGGDVAQGKETLQIKSGDWEGVTTESNLKEACNLLKYQESDGGTKWQCNNGSSAATKEIKLTPFGG